MTPSSVNAFLQSLRQYRLLNATQLEEINQKLHAFPNPRALAGELVQCGWMTPFQINQMFLGRGQDLVLGPYVLCERLGEGGVGQVFKAKHIHMQRYVALKVIRTELVADAEVLGRFYREIQAVSQLIHPNVVLAHDAGPAGTTHFFAMEYVEGIDLGRVVKQSGRLGVEQACDYIRQATLGLQHIHERGLIHRDIKPSNLLVTQIESAKGSGAAAAGHSAIASGQSFPWGLIKILDLGLARFDETVNEEIDGPLTQAGVGGLRGSADYLSPEQAVDFHTADIRADIYSLGCTFYYLLTGAPPYDGGSLAQKLMSHQRGMAPPVEKKRPDLPRYLGEVVRKMMAKKPADRFQTPAEVAGALAKLFQRRSWLNLWRT